MPGRSISHGVMLAAVFVLLGPSLAFGQAPQWADLQRLDAKHSEPQVEAERDLSALHPIFIAQGIAVLHELRELQRRPEAPLDEWAASLREKYVELTRWSPADRVMLVTSNGRRPMSADEADVRRGAVQKLLMRLVITGRISRVEYEGFARDLQGR